MMEMSFQMQVTLLLNSSPLHCAYGSLVHSLQFQYWWHQIAGTWSDWWPHNQQFLWCQISCCCSSLQSSLCSSCCWFLDHTRCFICLASTWWFLVMSIYCNYQRVIHISETVDFPAANCDAIILVFKNLPHDVFTIYIKQEISQRVFNSYCRNVWRVQLLDQAYQVSRQPHLNENSPQLGPFHLVKSFLVVYKIHEHPL